MVSSRPASMVSPRSSAMSDRSDCAPATASSRRCSRASAPRTISIRCDAPAGISSTNDDSASRPTSGSVVAASVSAKRAKAVRIWRASGCMLASARTPRSRGASIFIAACIATSAASAAASRTRASYARARIAAIARRSGEVRSARRRLNMVWHVVSHRLRMRVRRSLCSLSTPSPSTTWRSARSCRWCSVTCRTGSLACSPDSPFTSHAMRRSSRSREGASASSLALRSRRRRFMSTPDSSKLASRSRRMATDVRRDSFAAGV